MVETMTDRDLIREYCGRGSEEAFKTLVDRHVNLVFATAVRQVTDTTAAQEVTQNVFITLARKANRLQGDATLTGWLHQTTLLESRQWWRGEYRRQRREESAIELGTTMKDDDSLLKAMTGVLDEGLMELREADRQALMLRYFEECSHQEIGKVLGSGEDAVRKRIDKALDKLTNFFRRRGYSVAGAATTAAAMRAAAQTAPAGFSAIATKAALSAGGAATLTGFGLLMGTIMGLTKTQTVIVCAVLAAAPIAYQSHSLSRARQENAAVATELTKTSQELDRLQVSRLDTEKKLTRAKSSLESLHKEIDGQRAKVAKAKTNLYAWSDKSDYVRLPKSVVDSLYLSESQLEKSLFGQQYHLQKPVLTLEGELSPVLEEVLGITPAESAQVKASVQQAVIQFATLQQAHSYPTNAPSSYSAGLPHSATLFTSAFPEEGAVLRDRLRNNWTQALGSDRADVLWKQTESDILEKSNNFGTLEKFETVYWSDDVVGYGQQSRDPKSPYINGSSVNSGMSWEYAAQQLPPHLFALLPPAPKKQVKQPAK